MFIEEINGFSLNQIPQEIEREIGYLEEDVASLYSYGILIIQMGSVTHTIDALNMAFERLKQRWIEHIKIYKPTNEIIQKKERSLEKGACLLDELRNLSSLKRLVLKAKNNWYSNTSKQEKLQAIRTSLARLHQICLENNCIYHTDDLPSSNPTQLISKAQILSQPLCGLPNDVIKKILFNLRVKDIQVWVTVCRDWEKFTLDHLSSVISSHFENIMVIFEKAYKGFTSISYSFPNRIDNLKQLLNPFKTSIGNFAKNIKLLELQESNLLGQKYDSPMQVFIAKQAIKRLELYNKIENLMKTCGDFSFVSSKQLVEFYTLTEECLNMGDLTQAENLIEKLHDPLLMVEANISINPQIVIICNKSIIPYKGFVMDKNIHYFIQIALKALENEDFFQVRRIIAKLIDPINVIQIIEKMLFLGQDKKAEELMNAILNESKNGNCNLSDVIEMMRHISQTMLKNSKIIQIEKLANSITDRLSRCKFLCVLANELIEYHQEDKVKEIMVKIDKELKEIDDNEILDNLFRMFVLMSLLESLMIK